MIHPRVSTQADTGGSHVTRQLMAAPTAPDLNDLVAGPPGRKGAGERLRSAPLWTHGVALAVVLLALVPVIGTRASWSADEGAAIIQARHLARGDGWVVDHPYPQVDPGGKAYPLELSMRGDAGTAPFVKHPLYAVLLAGADRVGGVTAMGMLSLLGTLAAAVLAAALAGHLRPGLARPTFWAVGLATPLLFDGYLAIAHTLGAACSVAAVLLAVRAVDGRRLRWAPAAGAALAVAGAVLLRNEAVFVGLGLGIALAAMAVVRRSAALGVMAVGMAGAAGAAHVGEGLWISRILGGHVVALGGALDPGTGFVAARTQSFVLTWLRPGYGEFPAAELALVLMLGAVVAGAVAARRHPGDGRTITVLGVFAAVAALLSLIVAPTNLVPGLLVACPVIAAGLVALRRSSLDTVGARVALGTFAAFAGAVAATQYARGGSGEWGGRYFAIGLPILVPVALVALADAGRALDGASRRRVVVALAACSVVMSVMAMASITDTHRFTDRLMASADRAGRSISGVEKPVMITTNGAIPRLAWATFDRQRWLLAPPDDLAPLAGRLRAAGTDQVVLVTDHLDRDLGRMGPGVTVRSADIRPNHRTWQVVVLNLAP